MFPDSLLTASKYLEPGLRVCTIQWQKKDSERIAQARIQASTLGFGSCGLVFRLGAI